jgi:hypothetical protein
MDAVSCVLRQCVEVVFAQNAAMRVSRTIPSMPSHHAQVMEEPRPPEAKQANTPSTGLLPYCHCASAEYLFEASPRSSEAAIARTGLSALRARHDNPRVERKQLALRLPTRKLYSGEATSMD